ncbi:MAG: hypothetical protein L6305_08730 [Actinomycetia bacterium]|nr:hypothetical protein [Actinomycetes bacterium]
MSFLSRACISDMPRSMSSTINDSREQIYRDRKTTLLVHSALIITAIVVATFQAYTGLLSAFQFAGLEGGLGVIALFVQTYHIQTMSETDYSFLF